MSNQKFIRRTLLATAFTISAVQATQVFGFQQTQYQPGQPGAQIPQGNTSVTQELNRMFRESGQEMPSMNPQELPNGNHPIQGQIRLRQPQNPGQAQNPGQPQVQSGSGTSLNSTSPPRAVAAKSGSPLTRFFGKLRGGTVKNDPNYRPPVPPDYKPQPPSTAAADAGTMTPTPRSPQNQQVQNSPRAATSQSPGRAAVAPQPQVRNPAPQIPNGAMSRIPPRSGATVQPVNPTRSVSTNPAAVEKQATYTQPGSAPGFMSHTGTPHVIQQQPAAKPAPIDKFQDEFIQENTAEFAAPRTAQEKVKPKIATAVSAKDAVNGFENPFLDSGDRIEPSEVLDLDSLIEIPRAAPAPAPAPAPLGNAIPSAPAYPVKPETVTPVDPGPPTANRGTPDQELETPAAADFEESLNGTVDTQEENPFTGVQLDIKDDALLDAQRDASEQTPFGVAAPPMEDFHSELPAIELPPVDEGDVAGDELLLKTPAAETSNSASPDPAAVPAMDSAAPAVAPMPNIPAALNAVDTERLRQTAEQERRQRQQRQILVRAGQTGFKGFCPVELREHRELVESNPQFASTFGLQTYYFSTSEAKIAFDAEPSRYAPAAGGNDVVVLVNSGEEQPGQLDYALWYRDRLYLFRARETMTLFSKDPQRFASQY